MIRNVDIFSAVIFIFLSALLLWWSLSKLAPPTGRWEGVNSLKLDEGKSLVISTHGVEFDSQPIEVPAARVIELFSEENIVEVTDLSGIGKLKSIKVQQGELVLWIEAYEYGVYRIDDFYFSFREIPVELVAIFSGLR